MYHLKLWWTVVVKKVCPAQAWARRRAAQVETVTRLLGLLLAAEGTRGLDVLALEDVLLSACTRLKGSLPPPPMLSLLPASLSHSGQGLPCSRPARRRGAATCNARLPALTPGRGPPPADAQV